MKLTRKAFNFLPRSIKQLILRNKLSFNYELPKGYRFRLASSPEDFKAVGRLVHSRYSDVGISTKLEKQERLLVHHALPNTATLIIELNEKIIGTVSIIGDSPIELPSSKISRINDLRKNYRCAETSCLAISKDYKGENFFYLLKYLYEVSVKIMRLEYIIISTTEKSRTAEMLYGPILLFEDLWDSEVMEYDDANGNSVRTQILRIDKVRHYYKAIYGDQKEKSNLYYFFCKHECKEFDFNYRFDIPNPITHEAAYSVVLKNSFARKQFDRDSVKKVLFFFNGSPYFEQLKSWFLSEAFIEAEEIKDISDRSSHRFPDYSEVLLTYDSIYVKGSFLNRSSTGALIKVNKGYELPPTDKFEILVLSSSHNLERVASRKIWQEGPFLGVEFDSVPTV